MQQGVEGEGAHVLPVEWVGGDIVPMGKEPHRGQEQPAPPSIGHYLKERPAYPLQHTHRGKMQVTSHVEPHFIRDVDR